jgi:hypothetical protein
MPQIRFGKKLNRFLRNPRAEAIAAVMQNQTKIAEIVVK